MRYPGKTWHVVSAAAPWILTAGVIVLWCASRFGTGQGAFGLRAGESLWKFTRDMLMFLPAMFVLIGLFDVWVPRSVVERHAGTASGAAAVFWMVLLAMLQAGPLYVAFPVAVALWRKGCAPRNVFIYLGAFSAMKLPLLTFEIAYLGLPFSLARTLVTLPVFVALAFLLERLLPADIRPPDNDGGA
jgi:uncharacterized membrane protein YraQ (UPF0718 family)